MKINSGKRPVAMGAALGIVGATALTWVAVTHDGSAATTVGHPLSATTSTASGVQHVQVPGGGSSGTVGSVPTSAATVRPTLDQVRAIATRAGGGRVEQIDSGDSAGSASFDVMVVRADGTEVQLVIDARTGAVLAKDLEPGSDGSPDPQSPQDIPSSDGVGSGG